MEFDISTLTTLVSNIGFPIVCCIYMITTNNKSIKENTEVVRSLKELINQMYERMVNHEQ